jgi:hypothetical protein
VSSYSQVLEHLPHKYGRSLHRDCAFMDLEERVASYIVAGCLRECIIVWARVIRVSDQLLINYEDKGQKVRKISKFGN